LQEALQSVALQSEPCLSIVIVHGSAESYSRVRRDCEETDLVRVLHALDNDPRRKRGYPINVGIDYCLSHPQIRYIFLLDDDDIVYPFFTRAMASAFAASEADVVYVTASCRETDKPLTAAWPLKPWHHLFDRNFIPSNSYAVRAEALRRSGVRVDEDLDYLEDWHFLLRLVEHNFRFQPLDATLSEFRTESNAHLAFRYDLETWKSSARQIRHYINTTSFAVPGADLAQLAGNAAANETEPERFADSSTATALHRRIWDLEHSLSWKCTQPLRYVGGVMLRLRSRRKARV
jgi:hypothetical protein